VSPGPGTGIGSPRSKRIAGGTFGRGTRAAASPRNSITPGPGEYVTSERKPEFLNSPKYSMSGTRTERKWDETPGPAGYQPVGGLKPKTYSIGTGPRDPGTHRTGSPGPGAYSPRHPEHPRQPGGEWEKQ
jgi:hypothetical protein